MELNILNGLIMEQLGVDVSPVISLDITDYYNKDFVFVVAYLADGSVLTLYIEKRVWDSVTNHYSLRHRLVAGHIISAMLRE